MQRPRGRLAWLPGMGCTCSSCLGSAVTPLVPQSSGYRVQGLTTGVPQPVWGYGDMCLRPALPQPLAGAHRSQPEVREKQNASPGRKTVARLP